MFLAKERYIFFIVEFIIVSKFHDTAWLIIINARSAFYDLIAPEAEMQAAWYPLIYDFTYC